MRKKSLLKNNTASYLMSNTLHGVIPIIFSLALPIILISCQFYFSYVTNNFPSNSNLLDASLTYNHIIVNFYYNVYCPILSTYQEIQCSTSKPEAEESRLRDNLKSILSIYYYNKWMWCTSTNYDGMLQVLNLL